ncbi:MAG: hypothetical protein KAS73_06065 [Candidatus Sabulitectum sp.]|nr:hypothetical protein [Candidatus Sabulitectum sp.]
MRYFVTALATLLLIGATGCFGGGSGSGSVLLGQMPQGYDMYITIDPESMDLAGILEMLEDVLPEDGIEKIEDLNLDLDPFSWDEWKEELGILQGEIGVISLTEDEEIVAFFLPCGDGAKLKEFVEDSDFGDTEFFAAGEYTVMVVAWDDDDLLDGLEDALADDPLSTEDDFIEMNSATVVNNSCINFFFSEEVAEVPIYGAFSSTSSESVLKITVITDNDEVELYTGLAGEGLQSGSIKFPENTMAAVRYTLDMEWLAAEYENLLDGTATTNLEDIEAGLPFIGFESLEEFIAVFQGDFCISIQEIKLDEYNEFESMEGTIAISLRDPDKFMSSLDMVSLFAEADRDEIDDITIYEINENGESFWYFIADDVFYVTMNINPEDILDGVSAGDYFRGDVASSGFMGGAVDPEGILEGIQADDDTEEIIAALFEDRAVFSVSIDGQMFTSTTVAGPDVLKSLISLVGLFAEKADGSVDSYDMI